jgi:hypothetical protein
MNNKYRNERNNKKSLPYVSHIRNSVEIDLDKYKNSSIENIISLLKNKDYLIEYGVIRLEAKCRKKKNTKEKITL